MEKVKAGNPEELACPVDDRWARRVVALYPRGWSPKIDALRACLEQAAETSPAEVEETQPTE